MKTYVLTFVALLALTALTFGLSFLSLGTWAVPVAMTIAAAKAGLVAVFFMHLAEQATPNRVAALIGLLIGLLLIVFATLDVATRPSIEVDDVDRPTLTPQIPPDTVGPGSATSSTTEPGRPDQPPPPPPPRPPR